MKKTLILATIFTLAIGFIFSSCKKDNPVNSDTTSVRYEFTSDTDGNYNLTYRTNDVETSEMVTSRTWSKTIVVDKTSINTASLTAYPPVEWLGTTIQANATVKIFVNGEEKASNSGILAGVDRPSGLTVSTGIE